MSLKNKNQTRLWRGSPGAWREPGGSASNPPAGSLKRGGHCKGPPAPKACRSNNKPGKHIYTVQFLSSQNRNCFLTVREGRNWNLSAKFLLVWDWKTQNLRTDLKHIFLLLRLSWIKNVFFFFFMIPRYKISVGKKPMFWEPVFYSHTGSASCLPPLPVPLPQASKRTLNPKVGKETGRYRSLYSLQPN